MSTTTDGTIRIRELLALDRTVIPDDGGERFNRLIFEASPYLLQHAENPVEWYPWGEEAFDAARQEDKPVFLSIGYATCHWCHVMAHESFEDREVAEVINRHFVPIKVDREERPDIDDQYMLVAQMMTGQGGWPLTVIMTPDRIPFFVATYLPKTPRMGMPGITGFLENIATLWRTRRDLVQSNCGKVMEGIALQTTPVFHEAPVDGVHDTAWRQLAGMYDKEWGGFGNAPKFPMPHYLTYLLLRSVRTGDVEPLRMAEHTLEKMRRGGIFDQLGWGFHRYSVDRRWLVPHFEKMLYDQALIAGACLDAFRISGKGEVLRTAEEVLLGVAADLTSPEGAFYAALDADSQGEEGKYYLWTRDEVQVALGKDDADVFCRLFDITGPGNFEGRNILHLARPLDQFAEAEGLDGDALRAKLDQWRRLLLNARSRRVAPLRDEKVLLSWNGLMIAALAEAATVTGNAAYRMAAIRAVEFIEDNLVTAEGRLVRSWHSGRQGAPGFLEDYAFYVRGLIALHQTTGCERFLALGLQYSAEMLRLFSDPAEAGLFDTAHDVTTALLRMKGNADGVIPSGNAVAALNLLRLGRITGDDALSRHGEMLVTRWSGLLTRTPVNHLYLLTALDFMEYGGTDITLSGSPDSVIMKDMLRVIHREFLPGLCLKFINNEKIRVVTASVCAGGACMPSVKNAEELKKQLKMQTTHKNPQKSD